MKELGIGQTIENKHKVVITINGKTYTSDKVKTDGSYVQVHFKNFSSTIPRVYTIDMTIPDDYGISYKVMKP